LLLRPHRTVLGTEVDLVGPRLMLLARRVWRAIPAEMVVRTVAETRVAACLRTAVQGQTGPRCAGSDEHVARERPLLCQLVSAIRLDLVPAAVGQVAVGVIHHRGVVPVHRGRDVGLANVGTYLALAVAVAA